MNEQIFNLFLFIKNEIIYELGAVSHYKDGSDQEKLAFLQESVFTDIKKVKRFPVPERYAILEQELRTNKKTTGLRYATFKALASMGRRLEIFEEIFQVFKGASNPLVCITPVVDNTLRIDKEEHFNELEHKNNQYTQAITEITMPDYLVMYVTENGFDLPRLLNDDYFLAIKLLYNNKHYTSALKLLMSFIDTLAYLEFGNERGNFIKWLNQYADLSQVGVDASELWEFRNSLLHMTNLDSHRVLKGKVNRIMFYVGVLPKDFPREYDDTKLFSFMDLITGIAQAIQRWSETYNIDRSKFETFVARYDRIISDVRYHVFLPE